MTTFYAFLDMDYMETSALTGDGINELFEHIVDETYEEATKER